MNAYMGIVANEKEVNGIVVDSNNKVIAKESMVVGKGIFKRVKEVVSILLDKIEDSGYVVGQAGVTGDYRKLVGNWLGASICNEIMALAKGGEVYGDVDVILASDGNDVKIIYLDEGKIKDYEIRDLMLDDNVVSVFRNLIGDREMRGKVVITGDIVKSDKMIRELKCLCRDATVEIDRDNIMSSMGIAMIGRDSSNNCYISKELLEMKLDVKESDCSRCGNKCKMVYVLRGDNIINSWGYECERGEELSI